ncbi:MAG TPA: hypothetical protein VK168_03415 [Saprospiraceae bacterium]|nr:hypothetical protein [Saprospiraceae bacterium]
MQQRFILILAISLLAIPAKADTIDYWHVYYNNARVKAFNAYTKGELRLRISDIKKSDSLAIRYFRDTPCAQCETILTIEDKSSRQIAQAYGLGTAQAIKIPVSNLLQDQLHYGEKDFKVFYQENLPLQKRQRVFLFTIKLE